MEYFNQVRWNALWKSAALPGAAEDCFEDLAGRYSESLRHYHNVRHIDECLREFEFIREDALNPAALEFAIWFHDAIYDSKRTDNEERSAKLAMESLPGAGMEMTGIVSDLILTTKQHVSGNLPDAALLIDIDLSILGNPSERFAEYENGIRAEYSWVPVDLYREKRAAILRGFLERDRLFRSPFFHDRYETQARINLRESIAVLS